jgi:hypothetical protein
MADLVFILVIVAFFALAYVFVKACDRIIGSDEVASAEGSATEPEPEQEQEPRVAA